MLGGGGVAEPASVVIEVVDSRNHRVIGAKWKDLLSQVMSFDFVCCEEIAHPVLQLVPRASRAPQDPNTNLTIALKKSGIRSKH